MLSLEKTTVTFKVGYRDTFQSTVPQGNSPAINVPNDLEFPRRGDITMYTDERIEQFRKMAQANPDDDLAHFALGHALVDAERYDEAINVFRHVLKLNKHYSKAYVLMGQSQLKIEDEDAAIETFQRGYAIAMHRGDLMPATEMKAHLTELGATISNDSTDLALDEPAPDADREPEEGEVRCIRTRRIGQQMEFEPFDDEIGAFIKNNVSRRAGKNGSR